MGKKFLLLDCNYLCHRVKHSMAGLNYGGTPTGVIYGFLRYLPALQDLFRTSHFVFCWDSKTSKRKEIFPEYKANRHTKELSKEEAVFENAFKYQMIKLRRQYLPMIGFRNIFVQKGYESDDIIASICASLNGYDEAVIVSCDKDLYQLIQSNISFYDVRPNKILTTQGFKKQHDIIPFYWSLVKTLAGCSTDNVPGIKGVGEKTAVKYLKGELKKSTKAHQAIESKQGQEIYERNYNLVRLPFKGTKIFKLKPDKLSPAGWGKVTEMLGMKSIRDKYPFGKGRK